MNIEVIHIAETDSTNRYCRDLARQRQQDIVVWTDYQSAGRGCGTNTWESEPDKNLLFSVLLHPKEVAAADQFILSMANALALRDTLASYVDDVKIKWPNDIYWKDSKICGTLIETTLQGQHIGNCIIGTGLNINQTRFLSDAPNPVSLRQILDHEVDRQEVMHAVLDNIGKYMAMVETADWEGVRTRYRRHLYRLLETWPYRFTDGHEESCTLVNVSDDGHLELLTDNQEVCRLGFKEVQFVI